MPTPFSRLGGMESADAMKINWCEVTITDSKGKQLYKNALITDWKITDVPPWRDRRHRGRRAVPLEDRERKQSRHGGT
ncbi:MAG: hypothetical protein HY360_25925 [Verrucomicrobia bacterium]|nr:hypothetical protein [Verrucomicrobiota bacterium]